TRFSRDWSSDVCSSDLPGAGLMAQLPNSNMLLALLRDGFHPDSASGTVTLRGDGSPVLDYQLTDYTREGLRRSYLSMAEIQFAEVGRASCRERVDGRGR